MLEKQISCKGKISVEEMTTAIALMQDKNITITVEEIIKTRYFEQQLGMRDNLPNYASGTDGWEKVPSGYPNDSYVIGLSSGEGFSVVPDISKAAMSAPAIAGNGGMALAGAGGGMPPIQFVYQPFIGVNDEAEAKNKLRSIINDLNREAQRK